MSETDYKRPIIPLTIALLAGIYTGQEIPCILPAMATAFLSLTAIAAALFMRRRLTIIPLLLFFAAGVLLIYPYTSFYIQKNKIYEFTDGKYHHIEGVVREAPSVQNYRSVIILESLTIDGKSGDAQSIPGFLRLSLYGPPVNIFSGARISFTGKIKPFRNFNNPGCFDYVRYMRFKGIMTRSYTRSNKVEIITNGNRSLLGSIRAAAVNLIDKNIRQKDTGSVLKALVIGDRQSITDELKHTFTKTGTGHLLAISGLHIGIIAGVSFWIFCRLLSYSPSLVRNGLVFTAAALLALFPVFAYGFVAGMSPSTRRAVLMASVVLLSFCIRREHDLINTLAVAAMLILIISPTSLFSASFQLSFTAVIAIIYGMPLMKAGSNLNSDIIKRIPAFLRTCFFLSLLAFAGTLPVALYYFNEISLIGPVVNIILVPMIGMLVVPTALFAVLIFCASPFLAGIIIRISGFFLYAGLSIIDACSKIPFASVKIVTPSIPEIILYYAFLYLLLYFLKTRTFSRNMAAALAFLSVLAVSDIAVQCYARFFNKDLTVTILDVGQGNSALIEFPGGSTMLIDGGGFHGQSSFDTGKGIIAPFLWRKKIASIDTVVLTHPENDHLKGLNYILRNFRIGSVWSNGEKSKILAYKEFCSVLETKRIEIRPFKNLKRISDFGGAEVEILHPDPRFTARPVKDGQKQDLNNNSLVLKISFFGRSFLLPGDIMAKAESELVRLAGYRLNSTVLLAPHHGSKTSSTPAFLDRVRAGIVVVSAGLDNRFGMPHKSVMEKYKKRGCRVLKTFEDGAVVMRITEEGLFVKTAINPDPRVFPEKLSLKNRQGRAE